SVAPVGRIEFRFEYPTLRQGKGELVGGFQKAVARQDMHGITDAAAVGDPAVAESRQVLYGKIRTAIGRAGHGKRRRLFDTYPGKLILPQKPGAQVAVDIAGDDGSVDQSADKLAGWLKVALGAALEELDMIADPLGFA